MRTLHTFGDSFVAKPANWLKTVQQRGNYDNLKIHAIPGSSLYHLLIQFNEGRNLIKPQDGVIIVFTQHIRRYFKGEHYIAPEVDINSPAYKEYINNFFNLKESCIFGTAIVDYIRSVEIPNLPTSKVATFYSIDKEVEGSSILPPDPKPSIWELVRKVKKDKLVDFDIEWVKLHSPNHWIDSPVYEEVFFNTYIDRISKLLV